MYKFMRRTATSQETYASNTNPPEPNSHESAQSQRLHSCLCLCSAQSLKEIESACSQSAAARSLHTFSRIRCGLTLLAKQCWPSTVLAKRSVDQAMLAMCSARQ